MNDKYNGWANWETWNANLWLNNEEGTYLACREIARMNKKQGTNAIAEAIKDYWEEAHEAGWKTDEMSQHRIDWYEIAESFLED